METTSWKFNATRKSFGGARVLREAKEAALQIFSLRFPDGDTQLWATGEYVRRLGAVGIIVTNDPHRAPVVRSDWTGSSSSDAPWSGDYRLIDMVRTTDGNDITSDHPAKIHALLLAAERETKEFSVVGIRGAD